MLEYVLYEIYDGNHIENIYAALNYSINKIVFVGRDDELKKLSNEKRLIKEKAPWVSSINQIVITGIADTVDLMSDGIEKELIKENKCFIDVTGGDDELIGAAGMVASSKRIPIFKIDIMSSELVRLDSKETRDIDLLAKEKRAKLTVKEYIQLYGGKINRAQQKEFKSGCSEDEWITLYMLYRSYRTVWPRICQLFKAQDKSEDPVSLFCHTSFNRIRAYNKPTARIPDVLSKKTVSDMLKKLEKNHLVRIDPRTTDTEYYIEYSSYNVKCFLNDQGAVLEEKVYREYKDEELYNDCMIGVHIDWDGVIHSETSDDVVNEIDVIAMKGIHPIFISCKDGQVKKEDLSELYSIIDRFGDQYATGILAVSDRVKPIIKLRAKELGIIVMEGKMN